MKWIKLPLSATFYFPLFFFFFVPLALWWRSCLLGVSALFNRDSGHWLLLWEAVWRPGTEPLETRSLKSFLKKLQPRLRRYKFTFLFWTFSIRNPVSLNLNVTHTCYPTCCTLNWDHDVLLLCSLKRCDFIHWCISVWRHLKKQTLNIIQQMQ